MTQLLDDKVTLAALFAPAEDSPDEIRRWLGLSQQEFADCLGLSRSTIARWAAHAPDPAQLHGASRNAVAAAYRLRFLLEDLVGHEEAVRWLRRPNRGFRGLAPLDVMRADGLDEVVSALDIVASGGTY